MATNDILTLAEAKSYCQIATSDQTKDTLLASIITGVSTRMDRKFGPVVYATITAELHDGGSMREGYTHIYLDYSPVASITQVVEYDGITPGTLTAQSNSSQPAAGYIVNRVSGRLARTSGGAVDRFPLGYQNVLVSYVAGRFTSGTITDERFKLCAGLAVQNVFRNQQPATATYGEYDVPQVNWPTYVLPKVGLEALADEVRGGRGF